VDHGHGLVTHAGPARSVAQIHVGLEHLSQPQMLVQGGREDESRVGHSQGGFEGDPKTVQTVRR
jgi:hypothetical protein